MGKKIKQSDAEPVAIIYNKFNKKAQMKNVLDIKSFGAVGDGVRNDGAAIRKAITALKKMPDGGQLLFEPDTTYYVSSGAAAIFMQDLHGISFVGNNTKIIAQPVMELCHVENCSDIEIKGITFDYRIKTYAIAEVRTIYSNGVVKVISDRSLNMRGTYNKPVEDYYGFIDGPDGRFKIGIESIRILTESFLIYEIVLNNNFGDWKELMKLVVEQDYKFVIPQPRIAHVIDYAFSIRGCENVTVDNCVLCSAPSHMLSLRDNKGVITFKDLSIIAPKSVDGIDFISWRKGIDMQNNSADIKWESYNGDPEYISAD